MPTLRKPCAEPGCPTLVPLGQTRCEPHRRARVRAYDQARPEHFKFYNSLEWHAVRVMVLMASPICQACGQAPSTDAAHVSNRCHLRYDMERHVRHAATTRARALAAGTLALPFEALMPGATGGGT